MSRTSPLTHPETSELHRFLLGQISGEEMDRVEQHVSGCDACAQVAESLPGDRLLDLLRRPSSGTEDVSSGRPANPGAEESTPSEIRSQGISLRRIFGLGLLACVLLLAGSGCGDVGSVVVDPDVKQRGPLPDTSPPKSPIKPAPSNPGPSKKPFVPG